MATRLNSTPRPRRVSFQDTCAVIPRLEPQHNKPRLCTRTYSLCLSKRPSGDLLYDDTFIPNHPTTLTFHLPTITRAPPITTGKRSRRSSTGGTPGFFGFKGDDKCGLKSCLHKSAHDRSEGDIEAKKTVAPRGIHPTPPIVHCQTSTPSSLCTTSAKVLPHILSPIRHDSHPHADLPSPSQTPRSPSATSSSGFVIGKMSSFVTRPFLRRSGSSTSSLLKDTGSPDSASATRLSRSRSYSTSTTSSAVALPHPNIFRRQGRSQSFSSTITAGSDDDPIPTGSTVEVGPVMREVARHPGCIEEDVIEEEAVDETEIDLPPNPQVCDHRAQQLPTTITEEPSEITTITSSLSSVLPIQDCCEACTRNTLLGMNEDYIPPFSESAIRKIQREREEHEQNMQVVADAAAAAGAAVAAGTTMEEEEEDDVQPKRIWNGKEWVFETSELPSSEQTSSKRNSAIYEHGDEEVDMDNASRPTSSGTSGSRRGSGLFDTDKAKSMMVDEVEYVRRMRGQASSSSLRPEEVGNWVEVGQKRAERGSQEKDGHALGEIPSPDHGVWITSKPTSPIRSPRKSPRVEGTTDYLSAKPTYSAPSHPTSITSASTPQTPSFHRTESDDREADAQLVRQALQQEAEATRNARTTTTSSEKVCGSHNISEAPPTSPTATEPRRKKWYKIPLPSPLAV